MKSKPKELADFKRGQNYFFSSIENLVDSLVNSNEMEEYGIDSIGEQFLVLRNTDNNLVVSFVLSGTSGSQYIYECIYTDYSR